MDDDYLSGADSRLRKFLGGIRSRQGGPVDSSPAPVPQFNAGLRFMRSDARDYAGYVGQAEAAQNAPYGSIASRNDPNQYGSVASREFGASFGPNGSLNPQHVADEQAFAHQQQQQSDLQGAAVGAELNGRATAAYLQPLLAQFSQGMQRRSLQTDPSAAVNDETDK